jgi:hypothetical protein
MEIIADLICACQPFFGSEAGFLQSPSMIRVRHLTIESRANWLSGADVHHLSTRHVLPENVIALGSAGAQKAEEEIVNM